MPLYAILLLTTTSATSSPKRYCLLAKILYRMYTIYKNNFDHLLSAIQISKAKNAPAVPGAFEIRPVPNPVEIITCNHGASPSRLLLLLLIL